MTEQLLNERITVDPKVLVGKPTIRGLRISVEQVLRALASGVPQEDLLVDYPDLEPEDIQACLEYAERWLSAPADERPKTGKELLQALIDAGFVGAWADRDDIDDSSAFARRLRERLQHPDAD